MEECNSCECGQIVHFILLKMIKKDSFCFSLKFLYAQSGMFSKNLWVTLKNGPSALIHFKSRLHSTLIFSLSSFLFVEGEDKYH